MYTREGWGLSVLVCGSIFLGLCPGEGTVLSYLAMTLFAISGLKRRPEGVCAIKIVDCKWVQANLMLGYLCDGLASHPAGGVQTLLVISCYRNQDKL